jgi:hypothetical protein
VHQAVLVATRPVTAAKFLPLPSGPSTRSSPAFGPTFSSTSARRSRRRSKR